METVSLFLIQIETHEDTIGILHIRYASDTCPKAFAELITTGTPTSYDYSIALAYIDDARDLEKCEILDRKYIKGKNELTACFSHIFHAREDLTPKIADSKT